MHRGEFPDDIQQLKVRISSVILEIYVILRSIFQFPFSDIVFFKLYRCGSWNGKII